VSFGLSCQRAEELLSDHRDGSLGIVLRHELEAHLRGCAECRALRSALEDVVAALRSHPMVEPSPGLAQRVAQAALAGAPRAIARVVPRRPDLMRAAAAFLLVASGTLFLLSGPESAPARAASRFAGQAQNALFYVAERKDRALEDVRIMRVVIGAAFEGRLDRVNDRFDDYRRLLERRRAAGAAPEKKKIGKNPSNSVQASFVGRGGREKENATT
jgi:anti-sigma factor RsiW